MKVSQDLKSKGDLYQIQCKGHKWETMNNFSEEFNYNAISLTRIEFSKKN